jgi:hypothetical protein
MSDKMISKDVIMHKAIIGIGGLLMIAGALVAGFNSSWWVTLGIALSIFGSDLMRGQRTQRSLEFIVLGMADIIDDEFNKRMKR